MSANEHSDTVFECIRAGAEDYLLKPLTKKEVQYIWQHVWRRKHQPAVRVAPQQAQHQVSCHLPQCQSCTLHLTELSKITVYTAALLLSVRHACCGLLQSSWSLVTR